MKILWFIVSVCLSIAGSIVLDVVWGTTSDVIGASLLIISGIVLGEVFS